MAFLHCESCEKCTTATELARFYRVQTATLGVVALDSTNGRWGTPCLKFSTGSTSTTSNAWIERMFSNAPGHTQVSGNTNVTSFGIKFNEPPGSTQYGFWSLVDTGYTVLQMWIRLNFDMTLSVIRGTTVLATSTRSLQVNRYHYIEIKAVVNTGTSGSVDIKVDGDTNGWISTGGTNTANSGVAGWVSCRFGFNCGQTAGAANSASMIIYMDDVTILDGSGGSLDTFPGSVRVERRKPTAETASSQDFTPSTGTDNSANVDEDDPNNSTDYNSSTTVNHRDLFVLQDPSLSSASIIAYQGYLVQKKNGVGICSCGMTMKQSSTEYPETGQNPLASAYSGHHFPRSTNPAGGGAITYSDASANDWGYKKDG